MRIHFSSIAALVLLGAMLSPVARADDKLKGFYAGSGGISAEVHRVVMIEFAVDGTALLQQNWHGKHHQTWHAHWKREGKNVTLTYDAKKEKPVPAPLVLNMKNGALVPTSWDTTTLGILGPPKLTPFGGKNDPVNSVAGCVTMNDPTHNCVTWGAGR